MTRECQREKSGVAGTNELHISRTSARLADQSIACIRNEKRGPVECFQNCRIEMSVAKKGLSKVSSQRENAYRSFL